MTRPRIVRADTLDLQDQHAPSAKDHKHQNNHPPEAGFAPHQEQSLRHAVEESNAEKMNGPGGDNNNNNHTDADEYSDRIDIYHEVEGMNGQDHQNDTDGGSSEDGDLGDGEHDDLSDDDLMDKISSSPSIDDEDIDFEFVYALHNFVATVEGQANAAKGDTMVLLDDSNSYWWLVRIVKDGSIGYLPAEHIETPTERLARLNKHRNVDLSATMLGDNSEKSKNPLKKAMRRRNAKTVTFTAPTYIEASDVEYSTEEELEDGDFFEDDDEPVSRDDDDERDDENEDIVVEPLRPKSKGTQESEDLHEAQESDRTSSERPRSSEELLGEERAVSRSRNGTVRNTDSFFKDDSVETKKISLTPNLLRDESNDGKEERVSMESIEKTLSAMDKNKDDKKRKDKKPGMLSGLFKRKDKKTKTSEDDGEDAPKHSGESSRSSPPPKASLDSVSSETRSYKPEGPQRQTSKRQKHPPVGTSPTGRDSEDAGSTTKGRADQSIRQVVTDEVVDDFPQPSSTSPTHTRDTAFSSTKAPSPVKAVPSAAQITNKDRLTSPIETKRSVTSPPQRFQPRQDYQDRDVESPIDVSPVDIHAPEGPPGLDLSSSGHRSVSPVSPPLSPDSDGAKINEANRTSIDDMASDTPTWSDASLRSYLDDDNDIRDLFIIVHDKSNVPPAGPDHPITGSLFKDESKRLKEMTGQLDGMLAEWVSRRKPIQTK